jgi:hypothetical protein
VGPPPRRRPAPRAAPRPFTIRPWDPADGDASAPEHIGGTEVIERIRTRRGGKAGALVLLEDGRYAFTGEILGIGARPAVQEAARRQLRLAEADGDRVWWRELIGALAAPET